MLSLWSVIPFSVWWADSDAAQVLGTWRTWGWGALLVGGVTVVALILSRGGLPGTLLRCWRRTVGRWPRWLLLLVVCGALVLFAVATFTLLFSGNPRSVDGFAQLFHARMLVEGHLWVRPPEALANFAILHMNLGPDRWYSQYPPGQPAVLAAGFLLGLWWLLQPVFGVGMLIGAHRVARWTADEATARLTVILLVLSPFVIAVTGSELSHLPAAALAIGAAAAATAVDGQRWAWWGLVAGVLLGVMVAFRPLDAVAAAVPVGVIVLMVARHRVRALGAVFAGGVLGTLPTLWFNAQTTGRWSEFAYTKVWGKGIALGFHAVPWGHPLTPLRAVGLTNLDLHQLNVYLLDFPLPILLVVAAGYVIGRRRLGMRDTVPVVGVTSLLALLFFYFHRDTFYGPRLVFSVVPWIMLLVARSLVLLGTAGPPLRDGTPRGMVAVTGFVIALGIGLGTIAPGRLAAYRASTPILNLSPDREARTAGIHHAVVLLPDGWGTRLIARMWADGVPMRRTGRLYAAIDACTLYKTLNQAEAQGVRGGPLVATLDSLAGLGRPGVRIGLTDDRNLRVATWEPLAPECSAEIAFDRRGVLAFAPFLYFNRPALDGDIVWARDMRADNVALFARYGDRQFYRYELDARTGETRFVPVAR